MSNTHNFRKLDIWQLAMEIVENTYTLIAELPVDERFGLRSQMSRAAVSIPSNIAEGCSRNSMKEFCHFLDISNGSCFELETQLLIAHRLFHISSEQVIDKCQNLQRMIVGFKRKINSNTR